MRRLVSVIAEKQKSTFDAASNKQLAILMLVAMLSW